MILATGLDDYRGVALGVDVGTNTEIVLVKDGKMVCTSCASGPAFEGGQITHGMRAMAGAIDRVWVEDGEVRYRVIGGGEPRGFSGSALIDLLAALVRIGAADAGGRLRAGRVFRVGGVPFSQGDLRQLQLAKAAIRSGIEALLRETGTGEKVFLAGAFGMAIDPGAAVAVGLFPPLPGDRFVGVGNAAGIGACLALVSASERRRAERITRSAGYLELTAYPGYQELFIKCLGLPEPAAL